MSHRFHKLIKKDVFLIFRTLLTRRADTKKGNLHNCLANNIVTRLQRLKLHDSS